MTAETPTAGATSHREVNWHAIDWQAVNQEVKRLQVRIVKAQQQGKWGKVKALQHLLTHSFPTMKDPAMQALYLLALDPIAETLADPNSSGFRKERTVLSNRAGAEWIVEGDIKACFDKISQQEKERHRVGFAHQSSLISLSRDSKQSEGRNTPRQATPVEKQKPLW